MEKSVKDHNKEFLERYKVPMQQWFDRFKNKNFPIFKDEDGRYHWANRKLRRIQEKKLGRFK